MQIKPTSSRKRSEIPRGEVKALSRVSTAGGRRFSPAMDQEPGRTFKDSLTLQGLSRLPSPQVRHGYDKQPQQRMLQILLVDDDPMFSAILKRHAQKDGLFITVCSTVDALAAHMDQAFDVAIVDYDLGSVTGVEIVQYLENRAWTVPFLVISQSNLPRIDVQAKDWRFIHKNAGSQAIVEAVFQAYDLDQERRRQLVAVGQR